MENIEALKQALPNLSELFIMKKAATDAYNEALKAVFEETGIKKPVLSKVVAAYTNGESEAAKYEADQIMKLLEELE